MERPVLITGAGGMLGTALRSVLSSRGVSFEAASRSELDITDRRQVGEALARFAEREAGGTVFNTAAYTDVERAEDEPDIAFRVNAEAAGVLAQAARENGLGFVHVSTDFVFDGRKEAPYVEEDEPGPLSVYGASKLAGEQAVLAAAPGALVVRSAWLFGAGGDNFPAKIVRAAKANPVLRVVSDEIGSPTYTTDLAAGMLDLVEARASGIYHLAGTGSCSRFELAVECLRLAGLDTPVDPVAAAEFPTKARRPANSRLDCGKAARLGVVLPEWRDALARFAAQVGLRAGS